MKHTFDLMTQIRNEYEEMRQKHNSAIDDGNWELARQLLADYRIRLQNYQMVKGFVDKLASLNDSAFVNSAH
jgi:hypothetical protein|tara:strand:- start:2522 stop:2737 length:216 start_codon:yes stop_codon:yes gene_type:complete